MLVAELSRLLRPEFHSYYLFALIGGRPAPMLAALARPCVSQGSRHFKLLAPGRGGRTRQACWEYVGGSVVGTGRLCVTSEHRVQLKKDT